MLSSVALAGSEDKNMDVWRNKNEFQYQGRSEKGVYDRLVFWRCQALITGVRGHDLPSYRIVVAMISILHILM
jgi:hypothetical protein